MRDGEELNDSINWFDKYGIPLFGIQINPTQKSWTTSNKCYAQVYIDDAALGTPLIYDHEFHDRPYVDWKEIRSLLIKKEIL